ncbi:MAG TPA: CehA/McbA family metallohydrolase [Kofleriaceae bacterium]|nr:CehA/McbA family metallohydrolase [Kofleriaceae bacterium]
MRWAAAVLVCVLQATAAAAPGSGLRFRVSDAATGGPLPCQLVYTATPGTGTPRLALVGHNVGRRIGDAVVANNRIFSATGSGAVPIPPGTYDLWIGRGPEWTLVWRRIRVTAGAETAVDTALEHVVDTGAWASADFHVHATPSGDSVTSLEARALQAASVGLDVLFSSDHNRVTDYGATIAGRGLGPWLGSGRGYELTTQWWGHLGVFPLPASAAGKHHDDLGAPGPSARRMIEQLRAQMPDLVVMVNHPLSLSDSYFRNGGLQLDEQRGRPGFTFDFDGFELINGYNPGNYREVPALMRLWFDLIEQGHLAAAVGNSDSHDLSSARGLAGYPRNWISVDDDHPDRVTPADIARGIKARHVMTSTGPFLQVSAAGKIAGDLVPAEGGRVSVSIDVQAAPWVSVARVTVFVDGAPAAVYSVAPSREVHRFHVDHEVTATRDAYVVVRVDGDRPLPPIAGEARAPIPSLAVANPLFLDVDGNGRFDPAHRRPISPVARSGRRPLKPG